MTLAFDFNDLQGQRFQQDLQSAAGYKPLTKKDLKAAYSRYSDVGVKMGRVKGKTDSQLYKQATTDILAWWKFGKDKAKKAADAVAAEKQKAAAQQAAAVAQAAKQTTSSGGSFNGSSGGSAGSALLPNTAMSSGGTASKLPTLQTRADPNYVRLELARAGFVGVIPPAYALVSVDAFNAWLQRAISLRKVAGAPQTDFATADNKTAPNSGGARAI